MDGYYRKVLLPFVNQIVNEYKKSTVNGYILSVEHLDDLTQQEFAMCLFKHDDCDLFAICDNKNSLVSSLFKMLTNSDVDNKLDMADTIKNNLINYYKPKMQELIDEALCDSDTDSYESAGYYRRQDKNAGDFYWLSR